MGLTVLDTTVLLYALGDPHPLRAPCRRLLDAARRGRLEATTTVEVIQEFAYTRARRRSRHDAAEVARDYAGLLAPLVSPTVPDLLRGLDLFARHPPLGSFDAVLAASAISRGAVLVSADAGFSSVAGLTHFAPGGAELDALLEP